MKLCYMIMDKLKGIPQEAMYRVYTEEKIKYIMKLTDEIEDIKTLEEEFGIFFTKVSKPLKCSFRVFTTSFSW